MLKVGKLNYMYVGDMPVNKYAIVCIIKLKQGFQCNCVLMSTYISFSYILYI